MLHIVLRMTGTQHELCGMPRIDVMRSCDCPVPENNITDPEKMIDNLIAQKPSTSIVVQVTKEYGNGLYAKRDLESGHYIGYCQCAVLGLHQDKCSGTEQHDMIAFFSEEMHTFLKRMFRGPPTHVPNDFVLQSYDNMLLRFVRFEWKTGLDWNKTDYFTQEREHARAQEEEQCNR